MTFIHPFSKYGLALVLYKEQLDSPNEITPDILSKYVEEGLSHFRMNTLNDPLTDENLKYSYIDIQSLLYLNIKNGAKKGIYLCPNVITLDNVAHNSWNPILKLKNDLKEVQDLNKYFEIKMGICPVAGEINNGTKSKSNSKSTLLEAACCAITNTTLVKPYFATTENGGKLTPTAIIPDLELNELISFIQLYDLMINTGIDLKQLLTKKVYKKNGVKPAFSRPPIYKGNFPYAPLNSSFGLVGLLGAIGRWSREANKFDEGQSVLESLKQKPIYIIQYGYAQSVEINHFVIDLAKENKLSEIVLAFSKIKIIHPFDESDPKHKKGIDSRKTSFNLFSSRFLQLFTKPTFNDFISVRAEYPYILLQLFNQFFIKEMNINIEIVNSAKALGLWLNSVAYNVGKRESEVLKKPENKFDIKAKVLIELESSIFGSRRPAELLNVIVRAGRLSGFDAPPESAKFQEALLTGQLSIGDAKSMLMAFARTRNKWESDDSKKNTNNSDPEEDELIEEVDVTK